MSGAHCISWFLGAWERVEQLIHSAGEKCDEIINIFMHSNCYNCLTNKEVTKLEVFIYNVIPGVSRPPKRQAAKQVTLYYMWPACLQAYTTVSLIFFIIFSLFFAVGMTFAEGLHTHEEVLPQLIICTDFHSSERDYVCLYWSIQLSI